MKTIERGLVKLAIHAYVDRELKRAAGSIEAMYNPESLQLNYKAAYRENHAINDSSHVNSFTELHPGNLSLELLFDSQLPGSDKSVDRQLTALRTLCGIVDGRSQETRFLQVKWGALSWHGSGYFAGRMTSMAVRYTLFDRDGAPLRANVTLELLENRSIVLQKSAQGLSAPRAAAARAPAGTSLPLIAGVALELFTGADKSVGAVDYLDLAYANDLDHFKAFTPGQALVWPADREGH